MIGACPSSYVALAPAPASLQPTNQGCHNNSKCTVRDKYPGGTRVLSVLGGTGFKTVAASWLIRSQNACVCDTSFVNTCASELACVRIALVYLKAPDWTGVDGTWQLTWPHTAYRGLNNVCACPKADCLDWADWQGVGAGSVTFWMDLDGWVGAVCSGFLLRAS
jgi:hypothetical protein